MSAVLAPGSYRVAARNHESSNEVLDGNRTFVVGGEATTVTVEMKER